MKRLVQTLLRSLPALANVVLFLLFIFIIFGILGVHQFAGAFYNRCRETEEPILNENNELYWPIDREILRLCGAQFSCPSERVCGHPDDFDLDLETENISDLAEVNYGITNFDNIFNAMLSIFQMVTLEGWVDLMYMVI
jgi:hypothetical protein